jgi:hypothetical protein
MNGLLLMQRATQRKERFMYHRLILDYLTHYQPELKAALRAEGTLEPYLAEQGAAMQEAKQRIITQIAESDPQLSPLQREMEAEQQVREMFLPLP